MGQTMSSPSPRRSDILPMASSDPITSGVASALDHTLDLPDEVLALVFHSLTSGDRKRCSLVCRRWLEVESGSRHRLALDARAALLAAAPSLFDRFSAVSKLALKCDRRADSIGDEALSVISHRCPGLTRLKIRACRAVTDTGMAALAAACPNLRKISVGSCAFGSKGIDAILRGCAHLEEISIKRLRGLSDATSDPIGPGAAASSLRSICLKELYNGQCFAPVVSGSPNLKILKIFRCSGDWDPVLEEVAIKVPGITEIHLEKLQVSDRGLGALAACVSLEVLHLVKTPECTDAGLAALADRCRLLRKIHIDGWKTNRIGDEGLIVVARRCSNLQELVLIGVNPTARSLELIATNCRNLERLALCGSDTFGDAEISCIAAKCMALKKLCIKGCPVSDQGMEALADGCPKLVKVKVKKCRGVTPECAEWLRVSRVSLAVNLDINPNPIELQDATVSESGVLENDGDGELLPVLINQSGLLELPSSSSARSSSSPWKARMGVLVRRSFFGSAFRRWSRGSSCPHT
ncbi:F-box protein At1g47056-like [Typha angustifolia]|uniref:F-box protein At1g47056-like n=1 Tax=Typha angustifolia TaxID=59011 RepID=UPI003C2B1EB4